MVHLFRASLRGACLRSLCAGPSHAPPSSFFSALLPLHFVLFFFRNSRVWRKMEDDAGIVTKARSAYTWLDKLRFLKGLTDDSVFLVNDRDSNQCSDVRSLEETCKVLFNAKERLGARNKSRKLCFVQPMATEHIFKQYNNTTTEDNGNARVELWADEETAVGSMNGAVEEDLFWTSGNSERSEEALSPKKPSMVEQNGGKQQQNGRASRLLESFASEPPLARNKAAAVTRNRRSVSDLAANFATKTQMLYKFEETRVVAQEHRQQRSGLKRRQSSEENGKTKRQPIPSVQEPAVTKPSPAPVLELASDHPSKRPADSLVYITYQVFLQAGRGGLTAREAASRIEDAGLGAVFQGLVKPRIKIGKIIRNNPYYFQAGEGRYILCEAIVGVTQPTPSPLPLQFPPESNNVQGKPASAKTDSRKEAAAMARREGTARYWAQMNASGRTRVAKNRHHSKPGGSSRSKLQAPVRWKSDESFVTRKEGDESEAVVQTHAKPRLKGMYKTAIGGKPCKRSDGKNWQCPLMAPPNSNYCEHHQKRMMKDTAELAS